MNISSDLIPHNQFHLGSWLLPVKNPTWYYFLKKENANNITNASFIESVDEPLKELVCFLHKKGIKTTPSCSGHFRSVEDYEDLYEALEIDRKHIRKEGLELKDIETDKIYLYQDANYKLPWRKKQFLRKVMEYQRKGVLGIRVPEEQLKKKILSLEVEGIQISEKDGIVLLEIDQLNVRDNERSWKKITIAIKNLIDTENMESVIRETENANDA